MEGFTVISGYYDKEEDRVIPCQILAYMSATPDKIAGGPMAAIEYGSIENGVFVPGRGLSVINRSRNLEVGQPFRKPTDGEINLKLRVRNINWIKYYDFNDILGNLNFKAIDGKVYLREPNDRKYIKEVCDLSQP